MSSRLICEHNTTTTTTTTDDDDDGNNNNNNKTNKSFKPFIGTDRQKIKETQISNTATSKSHELSFFTSPSTLISFFLY
jgi:hypothetical protein